MFKTILAALLAFAAFSAFAAVDINQANQAELEAVKGVGVVTAGKILDERKKGSFKDWSDLMQRMRGIKDARAQKLSANGLTINGEAYHGDVAPADASTKIKAAKPKQDKLAKATVSKPAQ